MGETAWTFNDPRTLLNDQVLNYTAKVMDTAGNEGATSNLYNVTIDTSAPSTTAAITAITDDVANITGTVPSGGQTNDPNLAVSGTLSKPIGVGQTVRIYDGSNYLGDATVNPDGSTWTFNDPRTLADGQSVGYVARVADTAGNQSTPSTTYAATIDTTAPTVVPTITAITDNVGSIQGTVASGGVTDDNLLKVAGLLSAALNPNETVAIYDGSTYLGDAIVSGTSWVFDDPRSLTNGQAVNYVAKVVDPVGNIGTPSNTYAANVDIAAPSQAITIVNYADDIGASKGNFNSGTITDDRNPVINGTLGANLASGEVVKIFGGDGSYLGNASVSGTDWTFSPPKLLNGSTNVYKALIADAAGNEGAPAANFTIKTDPFDADGDGVVDTSDVDDDNDGILDSNECAGTSLSWVSDFGEKLLSNPANLVNGGHITKSGVGITIDALQSTYNSTDLIYYTPSDNNASNGGAANFGPASHFVWWADENHTAEPATMTIHFDKGVTLGQFTIGDIGKIAKTGTFGNNNNYTEQVTIELSYQGVTYTLVNGVDVTYGASMAQTGTNTYRASDLYNNINDPDNMVTILAGKTVDQIKITYSDESGISNPGKHAIWISDLPFCYLDTDNDGIKDSLDLDSDNDGITDNVEAQATAGYIAPTGVVNAVGLDKAYSASGLTPVDTDKDGTPDIKDANSDNDAKSDVAERGDGQPVSLTSLLDTDRDGLLNIFEGGSVNDGYVVSDSNLTVASHLAQFSATTDFFFRDKDHSPL